VQVLLADQLGQLAVARAAGRGDLEPRRLALAQRAHLSSEHLEHVHTARIGARACGMRSRRRLRTALAERLGLRPRHRLAREWGHAG
jgi:methylphosphotriester-DNA--protein-cysteine methyltransferase